MIIIEQSKFNLTREKITWLYCDLDMQLKYVKYASRKSTMCSWVGSKRFKKHGKTKGTISH